MKNVKTGFSGFRNFRVEKEMNIRNIGIFRDPDPKNPGVFAIPNFLEKSRGFLIPGIGIFSWDRDNPKKSYLWLSFSNYLFPRLPVICVDIYIYMVKAFRPRNQFWASESEAHCIDWNAGVWLPCKANDWSTNFNWPMKRSNSHASKNILQTVILMSLWRSDISSTHTP